MRITFKNVGLGDSIILESFDEKIGITDCKKFEKTNPTVEFIKTSKPKEILFIALSHPHNDHYSGMLELLQYCEDNQIGIRWFIHTCHGHPEYLKWYEIDDEKSRLLSRIFNKIIKLNELDIIKYIGSPTQNWQLNVGDGFVMHCLSPYDKECRAFTKQVDMFKEINELKCSKAANLLSSVFAISNTKISFLLTADAEKFTFQRLHQDLENIESLNSKLVLGQIPHHGSLNNHYPLFWKNLDYDRECPAVISVGENNKYNFPHQEVVKGFKSIGYAIYAANYMNGMIDFDYPKEDIELSLALDMDSEIIEEYKIEGDQSFIISED